MLPGCNIKGVFLGTCPHSKRVAVTGNHPPGTLHRPLALPYMYHSYSPRDGYDIRGDMLSGTNNITAPKRHKPSACNSQAAQVPAGLSGNTCCPDSQHSPLSERQHSMCNTTSDCLLDMVISDTGCVNDLPPYMLKPAANQAYGSKSSFWQQMKKMNKK